MAHEWVEPTHPDLGTIRCTRAAYDAVYFDKGFRLQPQTPPESSSKRKATVPTDTTTDTTEEQ